MSHSAGGEGRSEREPGADDRASGRDPSDRSSKLFDLRLLIGGLFTLYGLMVGGVGLFNSASDLQKSGGMRINLWTGIGMLVLGVLFLLWGYLRPLQLGGRSDDGDDAAGRRGGGVPGH